MLVLKVGTCPLDSRMDITATTDCKPEVWAGRELERRLGLATRLTATTASADDRVTLCCGGGGDTFFPTAFCF